MRATLTIACLALALVAIVFGLAGLWLVSGPACWLAACLGNTLDRME
jgi:hypothetical protein